MYRPVLVAVFALTMSPAFAGGDGDPCAYLDAEKDPLVLLSKPKEKLWQVCAVFDETQFQSKNIWEVGVTIRPSAGDDFAAKLSNRDAMAIDKSSYETCARLNVERSDVLGIVRTSSDSEKDTISVRACPLD